MLARAGDRDVRETALLFDLPIRERALEASQLVAEVLLGGCIGRGPPEARQPIPVAAEVVRQDAEPQPADALARLGGEFVLDETDDGDGIPLQPLRPVDRQQLDDVLLGRLGAGRELVQPLGVVEPGEEARERPALVGREESVQFVDEGAQLVARDPRGAARFVRGELDVEAQLQLDEPHELGRGERRLTPEAREDRSGIAQALTRRGREVLEPPVLGGVAQHEVERVDQRALLVPRGRADPFDDVRLERLEGAVVPGDPCREP